MQQKTMQGAKARILRRATRGGGGGMNLGEPPAPAGHERMEKPAMAGRAASWASLLWVLMAGTIPAQQYTLKKYSVEDGLAQSQIHDLLQDRRGFLWIATAGGGVSRFDGRVFRNFTRSEGLAHNDVNTILEDREGGLWFGTDGGLSRFDGKELHSLDAEAGWPAHAVQAILEDRQGNLWLGTDRGASRFDGEEFRHFDGDDGLSGTKVRAIVEDRQGHLWFGTDNGGVSRFDGEAFRRFTADDGLPDTTVLSILQRRDGDLVFATAKGVRVYDGQRFHSLAPGSELDTVFVNSMVEDSQGHLWLGSSGAGALIFDGQNVVRMTERDGLSSNTVRSVLEDREGNIWLGTYRGGLCRYSGTRFTHYTTDQGLPDDVVRSILEDRDGNLWFGTYRGGASRFDGRAFTHFTTRDGLVHDFVLTITEGRDGDLWFGTYRGASRYDGDSFQSYDELDGQVVRSIVEDRNGHVWFGTDDDGLAIHDGRTFTRLLEEDGLNHNSVMTVLEDRRGDVWIGTLGGINRYDGERLIDFSARHNLKERSIFTIVEGPEGDLWFGAYGEGVIRYSPPRADAAAGELDFFSSDSGLIDTNVVLMSFDDAGDLWIGTEKRVIRLDAPRYRETGERRFRHYGREEGFLGIECVHNSVTRDRRGNLWFGTVGGVTRYSPEADRPNTVEPLTHIVGTRIFLEEIDLSPYSTGRTAPGLAGGLRLPHHLNHVTFDFIGLSLTVPEKVRYRYRMEGFDAGWSPVSDDTRATYSNLPPGSYLFAVEASNNDGLWNRSPTTFELVIEPPYWQTWWFRLVALSTLLAVILTAHLARLRVSEAQRLALEKQVGEQTAEVLRQKQEIEATNAELERFVYTVSHDLKSPLITIRGFVGMLGKDLAAGRTDRMHQDIERILSASGKMAELLDELLELARVGRVVKTPEEFSTSELAREAVDQVAGQIAEGHVTVEVAPEMPSLFGDRQRFLEVFQNLIANAVQYMGDQPRPRVEVGCRRDGEETVFYVRDNGIGVDPRYHERVFGLFDRLDPRLEGTGIGLALVKRIVEVHDGRVWVESEGKGRGSTFCFTLKPAAKIPAEQEGG